MRGRSVVVALLVLAVLFGYGGYSFYQQHERMESYRSTEATILSASVEPTPDYGKPNLVDLAKYRPNVTYTYSVDGTRYESSELLPGGSRPETATKAQSRMLTERFREGQPAVAYYAPSNPSRAFLVRRYTFVPAYLVVLVGLVLLHDLLTPGSRWWSMFFDRVFGTNRHATGTTYGGTGTVEPPNPDENRDVDGPGAEPGLLDRPVSEFGVHDPWGGRLVTVGYLLALVGVLGQYFVVSGPPYDTLAYGAAVGIIVTILYHGIRSTDSLI